MSSDLQEWQEWFATLPEFDDGADPEVVAFDDWTDATLPTIPDTVPCDRCETPITSVNGPFVPGLDDGVPMHRGRSSEAFVCPSCAEALAEDGWSRW